VPVPSLKGGVFAAGAGWEGGCSPLSRGVADGGDVLQGGFADRCTCALCFQTEAVPWDAACLTAPTLPGPHGK